MRDESTAADEKTGGAGPFPAAALLIFPFAALIAWSGAFSVPMILDDAWNLTGNPGMESLWPPWLPNEGSAGTGLAGRPVTAFTFAVNHAVSGSGVLSYHAVNLAIHVFSALALFGLLRRTFGAVGRRTRDRFSFSEKEAGWLAFFTALIWLLHPLTTQAVTYITQRLESLAALFYLLTLYFAARSLRLESEGKKRAVFGFFSAAAFILGVGAKETLVTAPFAVLFYEWTVSGLSPAKIIARAPLRYGGYLLGLGILAALVSTGRTIGHAYAGNAAFGSLDYFLFQPRVIWHYIRLAFFPAGLCLDYGQHGIGAGNFFDSGLGLKLVYAAALAVPFCAGAALLLKRRMAGLGACLFFLILAPTSSFLPLFLVCEEHRAYLPLAALIALTLAGGHRLLSSAGLSRKTGVAAAIVMAAVMAAATFDRNRDYASEESIWLATVKVAPNSARAWAALGRIAEGKGETGKAAGLYQKAISLYPDFAIARINLGNLLANRGQALEAANQFAEVAGRPSPVIKKAERAMALSNLGNIFLRSGRPEKAAEFYQKALDLEPGFADAQSNLGAALAASGRPAEALRPLMRAIALNPNIAETRLNLAMALASLGRTREAEEFVRKARAMAPENPAVKNFVLPNPQGKAAPK